MPYEPPAHAELVLHTEQEGVEASLTRIFQALVDGKFIGPTEFGRLTGGLKPKRKSAKPPKAARPAAKGKAPKAGAKKPAKAKARPGKKR
jgi:hypothetical protein